MASIPAVQTKMVVFDTEVADLTEDLQDPVDLLFGVQLGGGTDINRALTYCQQIISRPLDTVLVLITDLYEGGNVAEMRKRAHELTAAGVQFITLLALNDDGARVTTTEMRNISPPSEFPFLHVRPICFPTLWQRP